MAQQAFYTKINASAGVQFSGGTIAQATGVLHTNNVLYLRGGSSGLFLQNADGSDGIFVANDHVQITTASAERMRIHSSGNVAIGTTIDINKLDVAGNINIQGGNSSYLTFNNGDANIVINYNGGGRDLSFKTYDGSTNAERMRIDKDGNVAIGRTAASKRLDINLSAASGEGASIILRNLSQGSGAYNRIYFAPTASDPNTRSAIIEGQNVDGNNNMSLIFKTSAGNNPTEKMRISQTGAIKFNTYGSGSFTGTAAYNLQVDSSGNIIEGSLTSGTVTGSGTATYLPIWTGSSALGNSIVSSSGGDITINGSDNDPRIYINPAGGDIGDTALVQFNSRGHVGYTSGLVELGDNGQSKDVRLRVNTADIIFQTSNTTRMTVKSDGLVGIGTSTPSTNLDIRGVGAQSLRVQSDSSATIIIDSDDDDSGTAGSYLHYRDNGATKWTLYKETNNDFYLHNSAASKYPIHAKAGGDIILMEDGNKLGVGASTPSRTLHVGGPGGSSGGIMIAPTSGDAEIQFQDSGVTNAYITLDDGTGDMNFRDDSATVLTVDFTNEKVGIGETSPDRKLHVNSGSENANTIFESTDTAVTIRLKDLTGSAEIESRNDFRFSNNAGVDQRMVISSTGAIRFNDYGAGTLVSDASGNITVSSGGGAGGPYLPLSGGTMTGTLTVDGGGSSSVLLKTKGSARIALENANATDSFYISNTGGNGASVLDLGGALSIAEGGASTFAGNIVMGDNDVTGIDELVWTSGTKLRDNSTNYLQLNYASTGAGGILILDGDGSTQGYLYADGNATSSFGLLDGSGSWAVKCKEDAEVEIRYDNSKKFETTSTGISVTGSALIQNSVSSPDPLLTLYNDTNGGGATIKFGDQSPQNQSGNLSFYHSDGASQGGGATFQFLSTETDMTLQVGGSAKAARIVVWSANSQVEVDYGFAGDVNTGMTRIGADQVALVAGANQGVYVSSSSVAIKHSGSNKILTTSTGIDITGVTDTDSLLIGSGATVTTILDEDNMASNSATALATQQSIKAYVDSSTTGVLTYQGTWNADTNSPTLSSGSGTPGYYYIVSTAGTTDLDGITDWQVGDWAVFSDQATDAWQKIDNTQVGNISGSGVSSRVTYWNGTGSVTSTAGFTFDGSNLAIPGYLTISGNQIVSPSNFTIDVAGDIILDADGGDILLKDGGTQWGSIFTGGGGTHLYIESAISDKDIIFRGNDDGTTITALTLDMSDNGAAEFGNRVYVPEYIAHAGDPDTLFGFSGANTYIVNTAGTTALTIDSSQNATFAGNISFTGGLSMTDSILIDYTGSDGQGIDAGVKVMNDASDWGMYIRKDSSADYGMRIDSGGANAFNIYSTTGGSTKSFGVNGGTGATSITGTSSILLTLNPTANNYGGIQFNYGGAVKGLSVYNSGSMVYGGESGVGTILQTNGQHALNIDTSQNATFAGDITVTGGDITIGTDSVAGNINSVGDVLALNVDSNTGGGAGANIQLKTAGTTQLTVTSSSATFAGDIAVGPKSNATVQVSESGNSTVKMLAGSVGRVGTYSNHNLNLMVNSNTALTIDTSQDALFASDVAITSKLAVGATSVHASYDLYNQGTFYSNGAVTVDDAFTQSGGAASSFSGDLTVGDELTITTITQATADPDKFLVGSASNKVGYINNSQVLSYIGAAPATGGAYLPLAGGTMTGSLNITNASSPTITLTDSSQTTVLKTFAQDSNAHIGTFSSHPFIIDTNSTTALTIDTSQNATFATNLQSNGTSIKVTNSGNANFYATSTGSGYAGFYADASNGDFSGSDYFSITQLNDLSVQFDVRANAGVTVFKSKGSTNLTMDGTNATFAGDISIAEKLIHSGDTNTYIQFPGTNDKIVFATNGVDRLTLDAANVATFAGNVVIPSYIYHKSDPSDDTYFGFNGNDNFTVVTAGGNGLVIDSNRNVTFTGVITVGDNHTIGDDADDNLLIQSSSGENLIINGNGRVLLQDGGNTKLETSSEGVSLIGDLMLNGAGVGNCGTRYIKYNCPDDSIYTVMGLSTGGVDIPGTLDVTGIVTLNNNLRLQDSDSLQLGNSQDLEIYHASGNSNIDNKVGHLYIRANVGSDTGSNIYIQAKSGENSIICNDDGSVNLYYNNSAKFYTHTSGVGAAGYYGFGSSGTSTGSSYYYRYGSQSAGATQGLIITTSDTGGSYFDGVAQFRNTNTGQGAGMFQMINFGALYGRYMNFYRGSTSNIIGYIGYNATNTAVTYSTSSSDIRLKKNIVSWEDKVLPKFLALSPKKFDFKAAVGDKGADKVKGFIAQYEAEKFPEVYQLNGVGQDARYGFHPMEMVPYLMKAVKELAEKNEDLERRLAALEK